MENLVITLSKFEQAQVKNLAKSVNGLLTKKVKLQEKINQLNKEIAEVDDMIAGWDTPIRKMTANKGKELGISDLVVRSVVNIGTDKKTGKPIMASKYTIKPEYTGENVEQEGLNTTEEKTQPDVKETEDGKCHIKILNPEIEHDEDGNVVEPQDDQEGINNTEEISDNNEDPFGF